MRALRTLTVADLRRLLEDEDDDMPVVFTADYGDYHHTPQALPIRGELDEVSISPSGYSASGYRIDSDDEDVDEAASRYLVIR